MFGMIYAGLEAALCLRDGVLGWRNRRQRRRKARKAFEERRDGGGD
jgi:hypothetical protein